MYADYLTVEFSQSLRVRPGGRIGSGPLECAPTGRSKTSDPDHPQPGEM